MVYAWRELPSATFAERPADVHFGMEVFAVGGWSFARSAAVAGPTPARSGERSSRGNDVVPEIFGICGLQPPLAQIDR